MQSCNAAAPTDREKGTVQGGGKRVYPATPGSKTQRAQHHLTKKLMDEVSGPHRELLATLRRSHSPPSRLARKATASLAMPRDFMLVKTTARSCKGLQGLLGGRCDVSTYTAAKGEGHEGSACTVRRVGPGLPFLALS